MHYIICEDEGSGYQFFDCISKICNTPCKLVSSRGNQNFSMKLLEVAEELNNGDKLLLAFDNIGVVKGFNPKDIIIKAVEICRIKNVNLWITMYYCFEEVFLSYSELHRLCKYFAPTDNKLSQYEQVLDFVRTSIMNNEDYYDKFNPLVSNFINDIKRAGENREHFCDALLANVSRLIKGKLSINKGSLGACWLSNCNDLKFKNKDFICHCCNYCMKDKSSVDKLLNLESNSASVLYRPFSDFFK